MTMMADFLLQPATNKKSVQTQAQDSAMADTVRAERNAQDFSRVLQEQRQNADTKTSRPPVDTRQTARQADQVRADNRADNRNDERRLDGKKTQNSKEQTSATTTETAATKRQNIDAGAESADEDDDKNVLTDEERLAVSEVPGLLDPLLEQIMQAQEGQAEATEDGLQLDSDEKAVAQLLAMTGNGAASGTGAVNAGGPLATGKDTNGLQSATFRSEQSATDATEDLIELVEEESELLLEQGEKEDFGQALASRMLAASENRAGRNETAVAQAVRLEGASGSGEVRNDTLLRSEAVQSVQATRQLPGQTPLNMQQPGWNRELVDRVMWLSSQNLKSAEIKLNPAELGRLDIRVQVGQEHTQITFASAHAGVRDSLDGQMHRLREMLEQQGMQNVDVEVADQSQQERQQSAGGGALAGNSEAAGHEEELVAVSEVEQQEQGHAGLVSYYV